MVKGAISSHRSLQPNTHKAAVPIRVAHSGAQSKALLNTLIQTVRGSCVCTSYLYLRYLFFFSSVVHLYKYAAKEISNSHSLN